MISIHSSTHPISSAPSADPAPIVVLGGFDGVHPGHIALLDAARSPLAGAQDRPITVYTFTALPKSSPAITTAADRSALLLSHGATRVLMDEFAAVRAMTPEQFVHCILLGRLHASAVVCGFNYRFGIHASGDAATLRALLAPHGIPLHVVDAVSADGAPVSSSRIREHLARGEMEAAGRLLSRPFFYRLTVEHGRALGRTVGMPTANQRIPSHLISLPRGVYATVVTIDGHTHPAMTNIGSRPTVNEDESDVTCETHILDYAGDLYGRLLKVEFLSYLRSETSFPDLGALRDQTRIDALHARACFEKRSRL